MRITGGYRGVRPSLIGSGRRCVANLAANADGSRGSCSVCRFRESSRSSVRLIRSCPPSQASAGAVTRADPAKDQRTVLHYFSDRQYNRRRSGPHYLRQPRATAPASEGVDPRRGRASGLGAGGSLPCRQLDQSRNRPLPRLDRHRGVRHGRRCRLVCRYEDRRPRPRIRPLHRRLPARTGRPEPARSPSASTPSVRGTKSTATSPNATSKAPRSVPRPGGLPPASIAATASQRSRSDITGTSRRWRSPPATTD